MRPVNLIPAESRRGGGPTNRQSVLAYAIVGVLVLVLGVVSLMALFDGKIEERQFEIATLTAQTAEAEQRAATLTRFTSFQELHDARVATIDSLAKSRFDWERVMRELAIVVPEKVWLTNLTGTVMPGVVVNNGAGLALRASATGPALEMMGCARNQRTVARLISAMEDIDGVSRVLVPNSAKPVPTDSPESAEAAPQDPAAAEAGGGDPCATRSSFPTFELVAAFDEVAAQAPDPAVVPSTGTVPAATTPPTPTTPPTDASALAPTDGGVAATQQESAAVDGEVAQSAEDASQATNVGGEG